jgi:hypothetical protein
VILRIKAWLTVFGLGLLSCCGSRHSDEIRVALRIEGAQAICWVNGLGMGAVRPGASNLRAGDLLDPVPEEDLPTTDALPRVSAALSALRAESGGAPTIRLAVGPGVPDQVLGAIVKACSREGLMRFVMCETKE